MAVPPVSLGLAAVLVVAIVVTGLRGLLVGYVRHRGGQLRRDYYDVLEEESKVQLLRELEAAAEEPIVTKSNGSELLDDDANSTTLSGGSSTTVQANARDGNHPAHHARQPLRCAGIAAPGFTHGPDNPLSTPMTAWQARMQQGLQPSFTTHSPIIPNGTHDVDPPLFVNAKQFHRIIKRRIARQKLEEKFLAIVNGEISLQKGLRHDAGGVYGTMRRQRGAERLFANVAEDGIDGSV